MLLTDLIARANWQVWSAARCHIDTSCRSAAYGYNERVAPIAFFPFSGWKESFFGDLHAQERDAIEFYTEKKVPFCVTACSLTSPGVKHMLAPNTNMYVGVDVGGTSTRIGLFPALDSPAFSLIERFSTQQSYEQQIQNITAAIQHSTLNTFAGVGVSIGGRMAKDGRSVLVAPNLPEYVGKPFAQDLSERFGCPVRLAHDTVCGLLGEKKFGRIHDNDRCAYLTLSTGTGAAFQLRKAQTVLTVSIEIGHQILDANTLICLCGQVGCLETFTGGKQLELRLGHSVAQVTDYAFWEMFTDKLALGLVNLAQLTRVEAVTVSGAIALNNAFLLPLLQRKVNDIIKGAILELKLAVLGENAPIVGAALLLEVPEETILH
jgi:glucokinase